MLLIYFNFRIHPALLNLAGFNHNASIIEFRDDETNSNHRSCLGIPEIKGMIA